MGGGLRCLGLLAKKNFLLLWQRKASLFFELFASFAVLLIYYLIKTSVDPELDCMEQSYPYTGFDPNPYEQRPGVIIATYTGGATEGQGLDIMKYKDFEEVIVDENNYDTALKPIEELDVYSGDLYHVKFSTKSLLDLYLETKSKYVKEAYEITVNNATDLHYTIRILGAGDNINVLYYQDQWSSGNNYIGIKWNTFQFYLDSWIFKIKNVANVPLLAIKSFPFPAKKSDAAFLASITFVFIPIALFIGATGTSTSVAADIVEEKLTKMREVQRMMGLTDGMMWAGWFIQRFTIVIFLTVVNTIGLVGFGLITKSDPSVVFCFLLLFFTSNLHFCFFLSTLVRNLKSASTTMNSLVFLSWVPYLAAGSRLDTISRGVKSLFYLAPSTAGSVGILVFQEWEEINVGVHWSTIHTGPSKVSTNILGDVMGMMFLDLFIYGILTWYFEHVFPGEHGVSHKPWFFLTSSYWQCCTAPTMVSDEGDEGVGDGNLDPTYHEKQARANGVPGVKIRNLRKTFSSLDGEKVAVDNLTLDMYSNQITALLGHNGAGKTTTINMLTGMFSPTRGEAYVGGHSIVKNMQGVRQSMGVCPQHNILFKFLTVQQHLDFFTRLKGMVDTQAIAREIDFILEKLDFTDKRHKMAKDLSGGMKRKLSVAIALCGGSKIVLLDEPSTGLDVAAKRKLWDILLSLKQDRTIIITTHSMDEADVLGDRIAIMAAGNLVCSGSSLFLKRLYGVGYQLTLVKEQPDMSQSEVDKITSVITRHVPSGQSNSNIGSELSYLLSADEVHLFITLFEDLEENSARYGISSFGVSLTTMEEVFIKAGEGHDSNIGAIKEDAQFEHKITKFDHQDLNSGSTLLWQQFRSLLVRLFINGGRSWGGILASTAAPLVLIVIGLIAFRTVNELITIKPRTLDLAEYPTSEDPATIYFADFRTSLDSDSISVAKIKEYFTAREGVTLLDITADVRKVKEDIDGGAGLEYCCSYPFHQLNTECIDDFPEGFKTCATEYPDDLNTYSYCTADCLDTDSYGSCQISTPTDEQRNDWTKYFENTLLKNHTDYKGDFGVDFQGALTLTDFDAVIYNLNKPGQGEYDPLGEEKVQVMMIPGVHNEKEVLTMWYSLKGVHVPPSLQMEITNLMLHLADQDIIVSVTNNPMPKEKSDTDDKVDQLQDYFTDLIKFTDSILVFHYAISICLLFLMPLYLPIDERVNKSKHLQQISGVNIAVYWVSLFLYHFVIIFLIMLLILVIVVCFQVEGLSEGTSVPHFILVNVVSLCHTISFVFLLSNLFNKANAAYGILLVFSMVVTMAGGMIRVFAGPFYKFTEFTRTMGPSEERNELYWVPIVDNVALLVSPSYSFIGGMITLIMRKRFTAAFQRCNESSVIGMCAAFTPGSAYGLSDDDWGLGRYVLGSLLMTCLYLAILILGDTYWYRIRSFCGKVLLRACDTKLDNLVPKEEDAKVTEERYRVKDELESLIEKESVVMSELHKKFGDLTAVQNISLGIAKGECFGLLGQNGAGKTTTFNMMTGDMGMTSGSGYLYSYDVTTELRQAQKYIGYCPQFDALLGTLTGRELLRFFANLRGIPQGDIENSVEEIIKMFNLEDHADKECRSYSGGNKRKLSTGTAIIGSPPLIFLDEPTAGVDPTARRFLWDVLCYLRANGCSIILTSHSMEECEALCTRIVIMVNGAFRCLGSIQQLKTNYSQGYTVCMLLDDKNQTEVINFVDGNFAGAVLKENYPGYLMFSLGNMYKWSYIFNLFETNKEALKIRDYSVSQTTLEQVFLNFAKEQNPPKEKKKWRLCKRKDKTQPEENRTDDMARLSIKRSFVSRNRNTYSNGVDELGAAC